MLDETEIHEALGEPVGRLFLALSAMGAPRELEPFRGRLSEYLRFLEDHLRLERYASLEGTIDREEAARIADGYRALLDAVDPADPRASLLVATGVRYFVTPTDIVADLEERGGFRDDRAVLEFVRSATGLGGA